MTRYANAQAFYVVDGDAVLVEVHVFDPSDDAYHPESIRAGRCDLLYKGTSIRGIDFDFRYGNSDGVVHVQFSHPPAIDNLSLRVQLSVQDGAVVVPLHVTIPVTREIGPYIPMATQPDSSENNYNNEFRSKKRIEENI